VPDRAQNVSFLHPSPISLHCDFGNFVSPAPRPPVIKASIQWVEWTMQRVDSLHDKYNRIQEGTIARKGLWTKIFAAPVRTKDADTNLAKCAEGR